MVKISISIIIPIYNVRDYLRETLDSIVEQNFDDYEVLMIDDGSTDDSGEIARTYSEKDPRFVYHRKENEGVSAARNTGAGMAKGKYLLFIDADDPIPQGTLKKLYEAGEKDRADIVVGRLLHLTPNGMTTVRMSEIVFSDYSPQTTLPESPKLAFDSITCGKLISRKCWDSIDASFPTDLSYCEDMPVAFALYEQAERITMLDEYVYFWRVREGGTESATQKNNLGMIEERLTSLRMIDAIIEDTHPADQVVHEKKMKSLLMDFNILANKIVDMDDATMAKAMGMIGEYMQENGLPAMFDRIPRVYAEKYKAIIAGDTGRLKALRSFQTDVKSCIKARKLGNAVMGMFPSGIVPLGVAGLGSTIDCEQLRQRVKTVEAKDGSIEITGCAYIRYLPVRKTSDVSMSAWIKDERRSRVKEIELEQCTTTTPFGIEKKVNSNRVAYAGTGYTIRLKKEDLEGLQPGRYRIFVEWESCGQRRESTVFPLKDEDMSMLENEKPFAGTGVSIERTLRREPVIVSAGF